jgi:hypothetical protein
MREGTLFEEGILFQEGGEREKLLFLEGGERDRVELYDIESPRHLLCNYIVVSGHPAYPRSLPFVKVLVDFLLIFPLIVGTTALFYMSLLARKTRIEQHLSLLARKNKQHACAVSQQREGD